MKNLMLITGILTLLIACNVENSPKNKPLNTGGGDTLTHFYPDTNTIPDDKYGTLVRYGRQLMMQTAYYIGPKGVNGQYTGNRLNCTNCHQDAGTKAFSFNLMRTHERYPQYRAREGKVLSLAERVNNCVTRPHNGKPLPHESKEMIAILSYLKWINEKAKGTHFLQGEKNLKVSFMNRPADPARGALVYASRCSRCHNQNGEGVLNGGHVSYMYPPLWGDEGYQPGSSMHRVIKQAQWLKANMPYDSAAWDKPVLTDEEALDVAAFVNDDRIHKRPNPKTHDYPYPEEKAIDYGVAPFADTFPATWHKFGPYQPIVDYWKSKGLKPTF